jgi:cephalosporin-C deacetylase-like acetyl esterase
MPMKSPALFHSPSAANRFRRIAVLALSAALFVGVTFGQELSAEPLHANGLYGIGENVAWRISAPDASSVHGVVKAYDTQVLWEGDIPLASGSGTLETSLSEPSMLMVSLSTNAQSKAAKLLVGAAVAPSKIQPSAPRPADFDAFWQAKIKGLKALPANPNLTPADSGEATVEYAQLTLDNINGSHVYGQLAKPKRDGKFPAMLIVQWAGVYGLPKSNVVSPAKNGWMALNIMAHDLPLDQPEEFYKKASATTLNNYTSIGNDDRETSYFLRMLLGCYRAADYLSARPDWDGRVFVVTGTSQGGLQGLATAGLHPKVTAVLVCVPAGCDTTGPLAGRSVSWPYWFRSTQGKDEKKVMETSRYFDGVNFASNIRCPALVAVGLIDQTSCPAGVFAAFNQIKGPKEAVVMVNSPHQNKNNSQAAWGRRSHEWLSALLKGLPAPVATDQMSR